MRTSVKHFLFDRVRAVCHCFSFVQGLPKRVRKKVSEGNACMLLDHLELPSGWCSCLSCSCQTWPFVLPVGIVSLSEGVSSSCCHQTIISVKLKAVKKFFVGLLALTFCFPSSKASYSVVLLLVISKSTIIHFLFCWLWWVSVENNFASVNVTFRLLRAEIQGHQSRVLKESMLSQIWRRFKGYFLCK